MIQRISLVEKEANTHVDEFVFSNESFTNGLCEVKDIEPTSVRIQTRQFSCFFFASEIILEF